MTVPHAQFPFADRALARRLERAEATGSARFAEARARLAPETGAAWIEVAGAYAIFDGPTSPLTQTFGLGLFEDPDEATFDQIEAFFYEREAAIFHEVSPLASSRTLELLNARGYEPFEFTSVLYQPLATAGEVAPIPQPSEIHVRIARPGEHDRWTALAAEGWSDFPELAEYMRDVGRIFADRADTILFIAEAGGQPVATAALSTWEDVALLAGASTIPTARGRGAQLALLEARLREARSRGCTLAMIGALPGSPSQRNAERHGFRVAYTRIKWRIRS